MKKGTKIPLSNASHPARQTAIEIIECVIEPLLKRGLKGMKYYATEDTIVDIIAENLDIKD